MPQDSIRNLKERIKEAEKKRDLRRPLNESVAEIATPQRNLYSETTIGDARMSKVYTSLGMSATNNFVNNLQSSLTPPFVRWAELSAGDAVPEDDKSEFNENLQELTEKVFSFIDASNFNTASAEMYYDLAIGTGALLVQKTGYGDPLTFTAVPTAHLSLEEGINGSIWGVFRKHKIVARLIIPTWPDIELTDRLKEIIRLKPNTEITLDEVCYYSPESRKWYYEVLDLTSEHEEERLLTRVKEYNPWIVVRWTKMSGEVEGRGQLLQATPDLKMLNEGKRMAAIATQMNAFGTYTVEEDGIINTETAEINPGGLLVVKKNPGGQSSPSIAALPRVGDTQSQEMFFEGLEDGIKRIMMDNKLPPETGAVKSATEIIQRIKEFQADFGAAFGRIMHEFITPLFKVVMMILEENGNIQIPTIKIKNEIGVTETKKITDEIAFTKIKMLSPIAKQQALDDVQNIVQAIQILGTIDPRLVLVGYKVEELPKYFAEKLGVPADFVRNTAEQGQAMAILAQLLGGQMGASA